MFKQLLAVTQNVNPANIEDFTKRHYDDEDENTCIHCCCDEDTLTEKARFIHIVKNCDNFGGGDTRTSVYNIADIV